MDLANTSAAEHKLHLKSMDLRKTIFTCIYEQPVKRAKRNWIIKYICLQLVFLGKNISACKIRPVVDLLKVHQILRRFHGNHKVRHPTDPKERQRKLLHGMGSSCHPGVTLNQIVSFPMYHNIVHGRYLGVLEQAQWRSSLTLTEEASQISSRTP